MRIVLTGGTGYIGGALLGRLVERGHSVTALVRGEAAAAKVAARGASAVIGELSDTGWTAAQFAAGDAVVHTASPGDATSEAFDRAVAAAAAEALGGTGRTYVHTGGIWVWGGNPAITEESPFQPPALTGWRTGVETIALGSGLATTIIAPGIVYGHGAGIPAGVFGATGDGPVPLVGDGTQRWTTVHVDDVAALYLAVVERGEALGYLVAASGDNPTVRELGEAAAAGGAGSGVAPESADASRERLGALFADALLLDQATEAAKARSLGWTPAARTLADELRSGSYATSR